MQLLSKTNSDHKKRPIKVVQFGEGNFLRAFVDYMIDIANEQELFNGNIVIVKPIAQGSLDEFKRQDGQYTVQLRGLIDGCEYIESRVITCVDNVVDPFQDYQSYIKLASLDSLRFVVSNTTEAGIIYNEKDRFDEKLAISFPAKLTQFLLARFDAFQGDQDKGLIILPVELIDDNGIILKQCVMQYIKLWNLSDEFSNWVSNACVFTSTLVDRIVTGYPKDEITNLWEELGYRDELLTTAEPFALWVIESAKEISDEFPLDKALVGKTGMNVIFTDDQKPYKQRKVRVLNGAHTGFVLASYLAGNNTVKESMDSEIISNFIYKLIFDEVIPTLDLSRNELEEFGLAVIDRFKNPYIKHQLLAISLNSVSKWRTRCLPSVLEYISKYHTLPKYLVFSLAALISFYDIEKIEDGVGLAYRGEQVYQVKDDEDVLNFFMNNKGDDLVTKVMSNTSFFNQDLNVIDGLNNMVCDYLTKIKEIGMKEAVAMLVADNE
ncbi:MAG: tagaturonate reductase [Erysipelotrichaceae bacterium]|nr:tagaturonate reductase [Erysipelotrichaceae bacterium]